MKTRVWTGFVVAGLIGALVLGPLAGCNRAARKRERERARAVADARPAPTPRLSLDEAKTAENRARLLQRQGLIDIALAEFERAIAINPMLTSAHMGVGEIHEQRGDFAAAERSYGRAAELEPRSFDAQYKHGLMLQLLNRVADSIRAYLRALAIRPDDFNANLNLATAYLQLGEPGPALPYAKRAVQLNGDSGPARVNLGAIYAALNQHELAVVEYQQAAELMELSPELLLNLAKSLGEIRRFEEMQNTLEQLIKTKPSAAAHERLATALFRQRRVDQSLAEFRKALALDPDYYPALNGVGVCLLNRWVLSNGTDFAARDEAIQALQRSLQIERRQPAVLDLLTKYR